MITAEKPRQRRNFLTAGAHIWQLVSRENIVLKENEKKNNNFSEPYEKTATEGEYFNHHNYYSVALYFPANIISADHHHTSLYISYTPPNSCSSITYFLVRGEHALSLHSLHRAEN
jgi:hypothetical protein